VLSGIVKDIMIQSLEVKLAVLTNVVVSQTKILSLCGINRFTVCEKNCMG